MVKVVKIQNKIEALASSVKQGVSATDFKPKPVPGFSRKTRQHVIPSRGLDSKAGFRNILLTTVDQRNAGNLLCGRAGPRKMKSTATSRSGSLTLPVIPKPLRVDQPDN